MNVTDKTTMMKYKQELVDRINQETEMFSTEATDISLRALGLVEDIASNVGINPDKVFNDVVGGVHGCPTCQQEGKSLNTYDTDMPDGLAKCTNPSCPVLHYNPTGEYNGD